MSNKTKITTTIPSELRRKAIDLNIRYSEAATIGLMILIKKKELMVNTIKNGELPEEFLTNETSDDGD